LLTLVAFWRRRQLQVQHLGNGKMMRTALLNGDDIAKDLKVPPSYLPHFIAHTLGAKPTYDPKKPERERVRRLTDTHRVSPTLTH